MFKQKIRKKAKNASGRLSRVLHLLLKDEAISGKLLLVATAIAIFVVNSPWAQNYAAIWEFKLSVSFGGFSIASDLRHLINDGLMAVFFLVISLEIKRELVRGELRKIRAAILPIIAAAGGIVVPIVIFSLINKGFAGIHGWGIPMTTDTAFAIGLLALLGKRIPTSLKIFLLTVMVVDDVAAIVSIAVFYTATVNATPLLLAGCIYGLILLLHWLRLLTMRNFVLLGITLWICFYLSGVHASLAGVVLGLVAPITARHHARKLSIAERLEKSLIPFSTLLIIPLFALANAGVVLNWQDFNQESTLRISTGIFFGLVVGKAIGITTAAWLATKLHLSRLPKGLTMRHIFGAALLGGVGFTLSIFIAELAFNQNEIFINAAKVGIFAASIVSAVTALSYLLVATKRPQKT